MRQGLMHMCACCTSGKSPGQMEKRAPQCKCEVALCTCVSLLHQVDKESMYVHIALVECCEVTCTGGTTWEACMCTCHTCAQYQN